MVRRDNTGSCRRRGGLTRRTGLSRFGQSSSLRSGPSRMTVDDPAREDQRERTVRRRRRDGGPPLAGVAEVGHRRGRDNRGGIARRLTSAGLRTSPGDGPTAWRVHAAQQPASGPFSATGQAGTGSIRSSSGSPARRRTQACRVRQRDLEATGPRGRTSRRAARDCNEGPATAADPAGAARPGTRTRRTGPSTACARRRRRSCDNDATTRSRRPFGEQDRISRPARH